MATYSKTPNATPEKVKRLLSSFLVTTNEQAQTETNNANESPRSPEVANRIQSSSPVQCKKSSNDKSPSKQSSLTSTLRNHDSYLQRLDTFSSLTWFGKPSELNPLICARYGWENIEKDMLQCVGCKAFLSGQLPLKSDSEAYYQSLSKLKKNLLAAHEKFCALAINPSSESFCRIPLNDPSTLTNGFSERALALSKIEDRLPVVDCSQLNALEYDEGQGSAYCKKHLLPDNDVSPNAVALAFTGWTTSLSSPDTLICCMCRRQVGLWNYTQESIRGIAPDSTSECADDSDEGNRAELDEDGEPKAKRKRIKLSKKEKFDPIEEHRHWCPWVIETEAQHNTLPPGCQGDVSSQKSHAFIIAIKVIAPGLMDNNTGLAHAMKTSPMYEGLRCFRRVMKSWSSPKLSSTGSSPT